MQHFFVPTDFSETAKTAFQYAHRLAKKTQAAITLVHIYSDKDTERQVYEQLEELKKEIQANEKTPLIAINVVAIKGIFIDVIAELVKKYSYDYIIVGMKGLRSVNTSWLGLKELKSVDNFWIGSHTTKLLEHIQTPIIVIPKNSELESMQQISLAIDTKKDYAPEVFKPLQNITKLYKSNVNIITIRLRNEETDAENETLQLKKVKKWLGEDIPCSLQIIIADSVHEGLKYYLSQRKDKSMLVMLSRKMDFLERMFGVSSTQQMAYTTDVPLLVLHT